MEATRDGLPVLDTPRLRLRPFSMDDAGEVHRLAGDTRVASSTMNIPHPYREGMAVSWIATHGPEWERGRRATLAVTLRESGELVGAVALTVNREQNRASMGYWIGHPYWGRGYATEAARAVLDLAFAELRLRRVEATHFADNPASGRVMEKLGMSYEGTLRSHVIRDGARHDLVVRGVLRSDWDGPTEMEGND
jgi:RimJ/RimL family protein N-acetyltransferase